MKKEKSVDKTKNDILTLKINNSNSVAIPDTFGSFL